MMVSTLMALLLCAAAQEPAGISAPAEEERLAEFRRLRQERDPEKRLELRLGLGREESAEVRAEIARALGEEPFRETASLEALSRALQDDLSADVREAAASSLLAYPEVRALSLIEDYLRQEQGDALRRSVCLALSTAGAHLDNPLATTILLERLSDDQSPPVRLAVVAALLARRDRRALAGLKRASEKDPDPAVRRKALAAHKDLSRPPRASPPNPKKALPPDYGAVKGRDPCGNGNGWCECLSGPLSPPARCMSREDCRHRYETTLRHQSYTCTWDKQSLE